MTTKKTKKKEKMKKEKKRAGVNAAYSMLMGQPVTSLEKCRVTSLQTMEDISDTNNTWAIQEKEQRGNYFP